MPVEMGGCPKPPTGFNTIVIGAGLPVKQVLPADVAPSGSPDGFEADGVTPKGWPVTFAERTPVIFPADFATLPPEEKQKILDQYRFEGIKLRSDIKDETIPLTRQTLDIP